MVGGGIGGLAAALFLARRGHAVTVLERDARRPGHDLDEDFFGRRRPGVPQAIQPHGLLAPVRTVLRAETPDVYEAMLSMGALERHEFEWFAEPPPARPGDEDLVTVQTRRIVLEAALHDAVHREPRHLVLPADQAYGTEEVRARLACWLADHPDFTPGFDGPVREEWESAVHRTGRAV